MSRLVEKYYRSWINGPTLFDHPNDRDRFYRFVKATMRYARSQPNGQWLRHFLEKDLSSKYDKRYVESEIQMAVSLFDNLIDYHRVEFPDPLIEMRDPYLVEDALRRLKKHDGTDIYSDKHIQNLLQRNFSQHALRRYPHEPNKGN